uniref:Uncharacterized protein n=1 Tax=Panagrolaimus sp. PS1159 TaxID=55785 RepID=A0AC35GMM9_9BILA
MSKLLFVLCVFLVFQSTFASFGKEVAKPKLKCHYFTGTIKCSNHSLTIPESIMQLHENYILESGLFVTKRLERTIDKKASTFSWKGCYDERNLLPVGSYAFSHKELYYIFKDICQHGNLFAVNEYGL